MRSDILATILSIRVNISAAVRKATLSGIFNCAGPPADVCGLCVNIFAMFYYRSARERYEDDQCNTVISSSAVFNNSYRAISSRDNINLRIIKTGSTC